MPLAVIAIALTVQLFFVATSILPWSQVLWDEAEFLMWIQRMTIAIQDVSLPQIAQVFWDQTHYPPLQSLLYGFFLAPFGFSVTGARIISLALSIVSAYLTFALGFKVSKSPLVGLIAALLFISSPILIYLQSVALKEALFIPLILLVCLSYVSAKTIYAGIFLTLLFFTKYEPAGFIAIALGIEGCIRFLTEKKKLSVVISHIVLFGIPLFFALLWIYGSPEHTRIFFLHINNSFDTTGGRDFVTNLLFYPRAIMYSFGFTDAIGMLLVITWVAGIAYIKQKNLRVLWILFTVNIALLAPRIINLQDRYVAITAAMLFTLAAIQITALFTTLKKTMMGRILMLCILVVLFLQVPMRIASFDRYMYGLGIKTMFSYAFNQPDANTQWFNFDATTWGTRHPKESKESMKDIESFIQSNINPHVPFALRGRLAELSPPYIHMIIEQQKAHTPKERSAYSLYHITAGVIPGSRYYTHEYKKLHEWVQWEVAETKNDPSFEFLAEKTFPEFGIVVGIYGKPIR